MSQQGQLFELKTRDRDGRTVGAYRYRAGGRGSRRVQQGGFPSEADARAALNRALERARRARAAPTRSLTFAELVDEFLVLHEVDPRTTEKLRWLLGKAVRVFGDVPLVELRSLDIATWRMTIPVGHRFDATQALRQVLDRAVEWGLIDTNPAKVGVANPQRRPAEMRPFECWAEVDAVAAALGKRHGPMVVFAAATGLRPSEWIALEWRDIDRDARVAYVRRAFTDGRLKCTKTQASVRAVPLQARGLAALDRLHPDGHTALVFPSPRGSYLDLHNFRTRDWKPAQAAAGIEPPRRVYDLRHTFATLALRAGLSTFDLSRYMGASLTMIDRHYGHLARDGREHAIRLLDTAAAESDPSGRWTLVDAGWTPPARQGARGNPETAV
jgi:integrase